MKVYSWLLSPLLAGSVAWILSMQWQVALSVLTATALGNYITYRYYREAA